jgi:hypothetical protein
MRMTFSYSPQITIADWSEPERCLDWGRTKRQSPDPQKLLLIEEAVAKAVRGVRHVELEKRFYEQAEKWQRETKHLSSPTQKIMHPSYQAVLGMGKDVVPLMLHDMAQNRTEWFWALSYIMQENPIKREDAGKMDKMIAAWVGWGKTKGLL